MNKFFSTILTVFIIGSIIIAALYFGGGLDKVKEKIEKTTHPQKYSEYVSKYSAEFGVPEYICYSVIKCESGFDRHAKSSSNALGLMQIKPSTFADLCGRLGEKHDESMLYDPETNIKYGIYYLSLLYRRFGVWETAIAAYNAGPGRVSGWIADGLADEDGYLTEIPIEETRVYVERVTDAMKIYKKIYYQ